ncbi:MAG: hypothetical protein H6895_10240 [Defluviimonas sp.]|uniref:hypothetical protein n=1 Tax=Albidovulum sp. TaxID=1872424 RepID=UPI002A27C92E|nr:hypothetical protein [Defluviimonas sp.]
MRFFKINRFAANEDGAVTVDWVVLTAAVVGLGVATLTLIKGGTNRISGKIGSYMSSISVP